jgi:hypothetical protein
MVHPIGGAGGLQRLWRQATLRKLCLERGVVKIIIIERIIEWRSLQARAEIGQVGLERIRKILQW